MKFINMYENTHARSVWKQLEREKIPQNRLEMPQDTFPPAAIYQTEYGLYGWQRRVPYTLYRIPWSYNNLPYYCKLRFVKFKLHLSIVVDCWCQCENKSHAEGEIVNNSTLYQNASYCWIYKSQRARREEFKWHLYTIFFKK